MSTRGRLIENRLRRRVLALIVADKILKGTKPGDIPIERPSHFIFVVNLKIAKALGITIPPTVMVQATRVIE